MNLISKQIIRYNLVWDSLRVFVIRRINCSKPGYIV
jgi:hypothetical protein